MLFESKALGDEPRFQDLFQHKTESTGQEKQGNTRGKNNCTFQGRIFILRTGFLFSELIFEPWQAQMGLLSPLWLHHSTGSQFLTATNAPGKKKGLKCFFSFRNSPVTLEPDCSPFSSLMGLQEVWLLYRSFCLSSPKISPSHCEGLTQAITHQVPAAVAQVSMAAAIRRQQWDGKVRNFFLTQAAPKQEFSDRFLRTELQSQLLLKNLCYCRVGYSEEASSRHSGERRTILVLGGHDLCLSLKPKWHWKFQNIKGIRITSFSSDKSVVKQSLLLILPAAIRF